MRNASVARLLVRVPNWIGDAVMCEPALRAVGRCFPHASLTVLARPSVAALLEGHPSITDCIVYDHRNRHRGLKGKWDLARALRRERFDAAVLFQNAFEAALLSCLAGIPRRLGYATDGRGWLLTHAVPTPTTPAQQAHYYVGLLRTIGYEGAVEPPRLYLREEDCAVVNRRLEQAGVRPNEVLIGLNPGSTYGAAKRWIPERFAGTVERLVRWYRDHRGQSARVVIVGATGEEKLGESIARLLDESVLVWSGRTTIRELMAVTARCSVYLTNDTGPMHVAAAFGVPVVAVFGPTDWRSTAPFGDRHALIRQPVDCAPCLLRECPIDHRCMTRVTVDHVVDAAERLLSTQSQPDGAGPSSAFHTRQSASGTQHPSLHGVTVYLDRDGTLIRDREYLDDPQRVEWFAGVFDGLRRLKAAGARLVVVTNQSGIARGLITPDQLAAIHARLRDDLSVQGIELDGLYTCPHHPDDNCGCRKPQIGMVEQSRREAGNAPRWEYVVGDHQRDIELGRRIGGRTVLVRHGFVPGEPPGTPEISSVAPDYIAAQFADAVDWIIQDVVHRREAFVQPEASTIR
ncbi:hypothetical protein YTPLAS18_25440 [Nitrospira sp.]|nr:hypothetical protein YTPLAS18_25440 [Nitrospira sp.]